jgi:hypothetical protein
LVAYTNLEESLEMPFVASMQLKNTCYTLKQEDLRKSENSKAFCVGRGGKIKLVKYLYGYTYIKLSTTN